MVIVEIYPPYIYSVKYDGETDDEFHRLFGEWNDTSFLWSFLEEHETYLDSDVWEKTPDPRMAASQILDEAEELEELFDEMNENTRNGGANDFDSYFRLLNGPYSYVTEYIPMKSYGPASPSLIRMYAIKLKSNTYIIVDGGIKLARTIQESPGLKDHVMRNVKLVRKWLIDNGIIEESDLTE